MHQLLAAIWLKKGGRGSQNTGTDLPISKAYFQLLTKTEVRGLPQIVQWTEWDAYLIQNTHTAGHVFVSSLLALWFLTLCIISTALTTLVLHSCLKLLSNKLLAVRIWRSSNPGFVGFPPPHPQFCMMTTHPLTPLEAVPYSGTASLELKHSTLSCYT